MLYVKTVIGKSTIHGIGLFADQFIPKGTVTWKYHPLFDTAFSEEDLIDMPSIAKKHFLHYSYFDKDLAKYVLCHDSQRFINHSIKRMNIHSTVQEDIAARDIQKGEELFCDYNKFDDSYFSRHGIREEHIIDPD